MRYQRRRLAEEVEDGRKNKPFKAEAGAKRPVNVQELYEHLVTEHGYDGSYQSVLRYVRREYPRPKIRTYRRVETPPGAQTQTDWAEYPRVDAGGRANVQSRAKSAT